MIRPLLPADVHAAQSVQWAALSELDTRLGETTPELTPEILARSRGRIAHLQQTDPDGAWVAEVDGVTVGCALALVRDGMWFLSLLMVDPAHQGQGIGRRLLDAALTTSTERAWILATSDPAALRRYQRAGFDLHASYTAKGPVDRSLIPTVRGVVDGSYDEHAGLLDDVARHLRGAGMAPDVPYLAGRPVQLLVVDDAGGRGFACPREGGVIWLGATTEDAARRLLLAAVAEAGDHIEVDWLTADQQWAIDVCLDLRLTLAAGASVCLRGQAPMSPYLPSGALG